MKKEKYIKSISLFFLIVFVSVKLSNLHAIYHIKDNEQHKVEHCDVCKFVLAQDTIPALATTSFSFEFFSLPEQTTSKIQLYVAPEFNKLSILSLYNKPPPVLS